MLFVFDYALMQIMEKLGNEKISFYEHLEPLLRYGQEFYGTRQAKGLICSGAGIEPARWSQFVKKSKNFTGYYVYKIMKSFKLDCDSYMEATGMVFTKKQIEELQCQKFVDNEKPFIIDLRKASPETVKLLKNILANPEDSRMLNKLFSD